MTSCGSASVPLMAVAAATSGLTRYRLASAVELRPLKFRLDVRTEIPLLDGAMPIPQQGPQANSVSRAPEFTRLAMTPSFSSCR